ncbi:MAG: hypothetical protein P1P89_19575 [Desulfobacterales bacterium]|nr:hypothetical protein [Desulfobacterales bacterium]
MKLRNLLPSDIRTLPRAHVRKRIEHECGGRILGGPFFGMKYVADSINGIYLPKLLGTYEIELKPVLQKISDSLKPDVVLNVGAAEGYYAVGMALLTGATVCAFEMEARGRELIEVLARSNGVGEKVHVRGRCDVESLRQELTATGRILLIMDVEGTERDLLDPEALAGLRGVHILLELHDFVDRDIGRTITERFRSSHDIEEIWERRRVMADLPIRVSTLERIFLHRFWMGAMSERRPERMRWFFMSPRASG